MNSLFFRRLRFNPLLAVAGLALSSQLHAQDLTISGTTYTSGQNLTIGATSTITTSGAVSVSSGATITYQAGTTRISLEPGFTASTGSYFHAIIAPDTVAPTIPIGLFSSGITSSSFTLTWSASADSFGVTGYEVQRGSTSLGTVSGLSTSVFGLSAATPYSMQVRSRDAAGNWSAWSTTLSVTTVSGDPNAVDPATGMLYGVEAQLGTTGHAISTDSGNATQLNVHKPQ
jgi:hypothetical protein